MVLGVDKLVGLVEGLSEREMTNPEGSGYDLRLGQVHEISGEGYLGIEERKTPEAKLVMEYQEGKKQVYRLEPGRQALLTTVESVKLPENITANLWARSTLYRSGIILSGGNVAPGYEGKLSFTLFNCGKCPVSIEMGARIVHILFFEVSGKSNVYRGQWKGGRVTAHKLEKQV